jgi:hypothetical protein
MAERTGGAFTPVRHPADLVEAVRTVVLGEPQVSLRNATTGDDAYPFSVAPDGAFHGFVRLKQGSNRIEIRAESEGAPARREALDHALDPNATNSELPGHLVPRRIASLEECLEGLMLLTQDAERERNERLRSRLAAEIERARDRSRAEAEAQRKRLELGIEDDEQPVARMSDAARDPAAKSPEDPKQR